MNGGLLFSHRSLWPTLAPLAARRQLVLYDQRGRGQSAAPPAHDALAALDPARLYEPDVTYHARYASAFSPAWFVDQRLAPRFAPPNDVSVTGVTIAARLRRDGYDWRDVVPGVRAPALLLHGEADVLDPAVAGTTAALLPSASVTRIQGAGHMPFWEAPAAFSAAVEFFLQAPTLPTTDG